MTRHNINGEDSVIDTPKYITSEEFWDKFILVAQLCLLRNEEADLYDVFDIYRTKILGGWAYTEAYKAKVDAEIAHEEEKRGNKRPVL